MGHRKTDPLGPESTSLRRHDRFVSAVTTAGVALIVVGLRNVWVRYFQGDLLGFVGVCTLFVLSLYAIYFGMIWISRRIRRNQPSRHSGPS